MRRKQDLNIDTHGHYVPASFLDGLAAQRRLFPSVKVINDKPGMRFSFVGLPQTRPVGPLLVDLAKRKEWLGKARVDCQLVGSWLDIFGYELPPDEGADWCRFMNECTLKDIKALPALAPLACVPLQSGALAARVLEEALGQGFHGVMIGTQPKGQLGRLDDPDLNPFWEACHAHKVTLMVHPMFVCGDDRVKDYDLMNAVGRVSDTSIALARLMFAGHLTRYPNMTLLISHGGAALPYALGRFKRNNTIHKGEFADAEAEFKKLYFDSVLFEPRALRYLVDVAGGDKVCLGSDFPFPIGDPDPVKVIEDTPLTVAERRAILGETAARIFKVDCSCEASP
ncbi:MAG TPA: amidohydrolase family protein [Stellaceae bacterium]|nr:amidohydrolase family protein [Stellaceae bacterium]